MKALLSTEDVTAEKIILYCLGPDSDLGRFLMKELQLDKETYLKFMVTMCIQAAYKVTSTQLFHQHSLLKQHALLPKEEYNKIWQVWSTKKKVKQHTMSTGRRDSCIWEGLEKIVNALCRSVSIVEREGKIGIALDDDKVWMHLEHSSMDDLFGLRYATHVQANRKGIIGHTAVSSGANVPLGVVFERTKDSTINCFTRLLGSLFDRDGRTDLNNVFVFSDRGYMLPNVVFDYLLSRGANVIGTVKRMAQCWPFTFEQKLKENDKRTLIDVKGAPTLFLKVTRKGTRNLFASAFRNGTGRVATGISSCHRRHEWEGVVLKPAELRAYNEDQTSLSPSFFQRVDNLFPQESDDEEDESGDEEADYIIDEVDSLLNDTIVKETMRQGKKKFTLF